MDASWARTNAGWPPEPPAATWFPSAPCFAPRVVGGAAHEPLGGGIGQTPVRRSAKRPESQANVRMTRHPQRLGHISKQRGCPGALTEDQCAALEKGPGGQRPTGVTGDRFVEHTSLRRDPEGDLCGGAEVQGNSGFGNCGARKLEMGPSPGVSGRTLRFICGVAGQTGPKRTPGRSGQTGPKRPPGPNPKRWARENCARTAWRKSLGFRVRPKPLLFP